MPRGEETLEEGRQESSEVQEQPKEVSEETRRVEQATTEPEAVVERERPVQESEAIEDAVVEAVEAAETTDDGRPGTEDGRRETEGAAETEVRSEGGDEEATATPIPIPGEGLDTDPETAEDQVRAEEEVTATPIPIPGEGIDPGQETAEDQVEMRKEVQDRGDAAASPEAAEQMVDPEELVQEPGRETADRQTEEQQGRGEGEREGERDTEDGRRETESLGVDENDEGRKETEVGRSETESAGVEGRDEEQEKTVPAVEAPESDGQGQSEPGREGEQADEEEQLIHGKVVTDQEVGSEVLEGEEPGGEWEESSGGTPPVLDVEAEVLEGESELPPEEPGVEQEDQGVEVVSTEEPEGGKSEQASGEEMSETSEFQPPEMYAHVGKDGKITLVDKDGNPIESPPIHGNKVAQGEVTAWYPAIGETETFKVKLYQQDVTELYASYDAKGTRIIVDKNGKPLKCPPDWKFQQIYDDRLSIVAKDPAGDWKELQEYKPRPEGELFFSWDEKNDVIIVDRNGDPVESSPSIKVDKHTSDETYVFLKNAKGEWKKIDSYKTDLSDVYAALDKDGNRMFVDDKGEPLSSPPGYKVQPSSHGVRILASYDGEEWVEIPDFKPSIDAVYAHEGPNGTVFVDRYGKPLKHQIKYKKITMEASQGGGFMIVANYPGSDEKIEIPYYKQPIRDMYIHVDQEGNPTVVDADGKPIDSPPGIYIAPGSGLGYDYTVKYPGEKEQIIPYYKPKSIKEPEE